MATEDQIRNGQIEDLVKQKLGDTGVFLQSIPHGHIKPDDMEIYPNFCLAANGQENKTAATELENLARRHELTRYVQRDGDLIRLVAPKDKMLDALGIIELVPLDITAYATGFKGANFLDEPITPEAFEAQKEYVKNLARSHFSLGGNIQFVDGVSDAGHPTICLQLNKQATSGAASMASTVKSFRDGALRTGISSYLKSDDNVMTLNPPMLAWGVRLDPSRKQEALARERAERDGRPDPSKVIFYNAVPAFGTLYEKTSAALRQQFNDNNVTIEPFQNGEFIRVNTGNATDLHAAARVIHALQPAYDEFCKQHGLPKEYVSKESGPNHVLDARRVAQALGADLMLTPRQNVRGG